MKTCRECGIEITTGRVCQPCYETSPRGRTATAVNKIAAELGVTGNYPIYYVPAGMQPVGYVSDIGHIGFSLSVEGTLTDGDLRILWQATSWDCLGGVGHPKLLTGLVPVPATPVQVDKPVKSTPQTDEYGNILDEAGEYNL